MNEQEIFLAARQEPLATRGEYLNRVCGQDAVLRKRIEALLAADGGDQSLLAESSLYDATKLFRPVCEEAGSVIGQFKLLEKLGEGGMGTVWMAQQSEPVKRLVALKLIRPGMDSVSVLRRFDAERQALALMSHNNIAKMFGAEKTDTGRPYFIMELVKGVPITKYCDEVHATVEERLRLFIPVCQAVQHAHQKGIIHRDIKPSNVLVCMEDGKPVPKVIDFGVAKALHQPLTDGTLHTGFNQIVGTLEYMSPEQAELNALDVDTRADIYALGVLLFELLTGSTPVTRDELRQVALVGMLRQLKEVEPRKPSTRLSESKETIASLAALRRTDPSKLLKDVRGDLDWIVLKCLEADRLRRYETANALVREIERHLGNEPVEARAPSRVYRMKKFVSRNRWPVLGAGLVLIALFIGIVGLAWGQSVADKGRKLAEQKEGEAQQLVIKEREAKELAFKRLTQIERGIEILAFIFQDLDPEREKEGESLVVALGKRLEKAAKELDGNAIGDPAIVAKMQIQLGVSLLGLGYPEKAAELLIKARETCQETLGYEHPDTLASMHCLATCYDDLRRHAEAAKLFEQTLALRKAKHGRDHSATLNTMSKLAISYSYLGRTSEAVELYREVLKLRQATQGPKHRLTLTAMGNLASGLCELGQFSEAIKLCEDILSLRKEILGHEHAETLLAMRNLAGCYKNENRLDEALKLMDETLRLHQNKLGKTHPNSLDLMGGLAATYWQAGKLNQSIPLLGRVDIDLA